MGQRPSGEELERLYVEQGLTLEQVAEQVGFSSASVRNWLKEAGVDRRPSATAKEKRPLEERCPIPLDDLRRMYVEDEMSMAEIGERIERNQASVGGWLAEMGVAARGVASEYPYEDGWRLVVSREEVPYDTTWEGKTLTVPVDLLECGHQMRASLRRGSATRREWEPKPRARRCHKCILSQEQS